MTCSTVLSWPLGQPIASTMDTPENLFLLAVKQVPNQVVSAPQNHNYEFWYCAALPRNSGRDRIGGCCKHRNLGRKSSGDSSDLRFPSASTTDQALGIR